MLFSFAFVEYLNHDMTVLSSVCLMLTAVYLLKPQLLSPEINQ